MEQKLKTVTGLLAISGWCLLSTSCKTIDFGKKGKDTPPTAASPSEGEALSGPMKLPVGTILSVHSEGGFALISSSRSASIEPGTDIFTYGPTGAQTATLRMSAARKGAFLTADILSGTPMRGDNAVMDFTLRRKKADPLGMPAGGADDVQVLE